MRFVLLLAFACSARAFTCNHCSNEGCESGTCEGDFCYDSYRYDKVTAETTADRGCYSPVAGESLNFAGLNVTGSFLCDSAVHEGYELSVCICQGDKCNGGSTHKGQPGTGATCYEGDPAVGKQCTGTACVFVGVKDGGAGCESHGLEFVVLDLTKPTGSAQCRKSITFDGETPENCICGQDLCNKGSLNQTYDRPTVTCEVSKKLNSGTKSCTGTACFIRGFQVSGINGFDRGCVLISGSDPILPFCDRGKLGGDADETHTCMCSEDNCNTDLDTAIASMTPTTTSHTTTTSTSTRPPSTTKGAKTATAGVAFGVFAVVAALRY